MDPLLVMLRLLHVGLGVFWAGTIFFIVLYLEPSVRAAGPAGGAVMQGLQERRLMIVLPIVALLTLVTGFWLYFWLWGGARAGTVAGMTLGAGGVAATVAFIIGFFVMRPAQMAAATLDPATQGPQVARLRGRARTAARWVAALLAVAVVTMAVGRYV